LEVGTLFSKCLLSSQCFLLKVSTYSPLKLASNLKMFAVALKMSPVLSMLLVKSQPLAILGSWHFILKMSAVLSVLLAKSQPHTTL
jgi:hypothetical protein